MKEFMLKYKSVNIEVLRDATNGMPYVMHHGRKLYFPASYDDQKLTTLYRSLIIEQDIESAHRYVTSYDELSGKTLLDIGSAEGIFSLDTIEYTKHVYLFECEEFWIDSLNATFAPYKDKVTIIRKYVGDKSEGNFTTIDDFMKDKSVDDLFLKMDIEGAELKVLLDCKDQLHKIKYLFVEYHSWVSSQQELNVLLDLLTQCGFRYYIHSIGEVLKQPFVDRTFSNGMDVQLDIHAVNERN